MTKIKISEIVKGVVFFMEGNPHALYEALENPKKSDSYGGNYYELNTYQTAAGRNQKAILSDAYSFIKVEEKMLELYFKLKDNSADMNSFQSLYKVNSTLGSDPEFFVVDDKGLMIPSFLFLPDKKKPAHGLDYAFTMYGGKGKPTYTAQETLFWDGFQAEFTTVPKGCMAYFLDSTASGLKSLNHYAKQFNPKARLTLQSTMDIDENLFAIAQPEHIEFGCMPSENAYGMKGLQKDGREVNFRSAGGHIHFGIDNSNKEAIKAGVKALDKILGVACVSLFAGYDQAKRREMYGLAGEYRVPKHGLEYRTLSNAWMAHPIISNLVLELSRFALAAGYNSKVIEKWDATEEETIRCINTCDVELAREILARNKYRLIAMFQRFGMERAVNIYKIFMLGMDSIVENPNDITGNWNLNSSIWSTHCAGEGYQITSIEKNKLYKKLEENNQTEIYEEMVAEIKEVEAGNIPETTEENEVKAVNS